jgi:hypothetical protein
VKGTLVAALLLLGACGPDCPDDEFIVKVAGTCTTAPTTVIVRARSCFLQILAPDATSGLPPQGQLDQAAEPVRRGGWQIYGPVCAASDPMCKTPTEFRRCFATRVQWRLELECQDGAGAPVCKAELTE